VVKNKTLLYGNGVHGTREWSIWNDGNRIIIEGNGALFEEVITEGKAGRSIPEQVQLRMNARIKSKLDGGFKRTTEELKAGNTNQMGLLMPMLAQSYKNIKNLDKKRCYLQPKLDGHRCLITRQGNDIIAYSRRGTLIKVLGHITDKIQIPDGMYLDGEIFLKDVPLQKIASLCKRDNPIEGTDKLQFHIYDTIVPEESSMNFMDRQKELDSFSFWGDTVQRVRTLKYNSSRTLEDYHDACVSNGYEGLIIRPEKGLYDIGKRSKTLIKLKVRIDAEYKIVDIIESKLNHMGILILLLPDGNTFKALAPGTVPNKQMMLQKKDLFIGKFCTGEFAMLTEDGVPFHFVAIRVREDI